MHYTTYTGKKPFAWQVCDRKLALTHLVQHQITHSDVLNAVIVQKVDLSNPFACQVCDRKFALIIEH